MNKFKINEKDALNWLFVLPFKSIFQLVLVIYKLKFKIVDQSTN